MASLLHWYFQGRSRNCYSVAWLKVRPVLLEIFPRRIPSNKRRNRHSCFRYHIRFLEHSCKRQRLQAVHLLFENTNSQRMSSQTVRSDQRSMLQTDSFLHSLSHEKNLRKLIRRKGIKGTAKSPSKFVVNSSCKSLLNLTPVIKIVYSVFVEMSILKIVDCKSYLYNN